MTSPATISLLQAKVAQIRKKYPNDPRPIGFRLTAPWTGPATLRVDGEDIPTLYCPSPLAFRAELVEHEGSSVVLLTDRKSQELGVDVLMRLVKRDLITLDSMQVLRERLGIQQTDPRLRNLKWLPDLLLALGEEALPQPAGQALDADEVWQALLKLQGFSDPRPDLRTVLEWATAGASPFLSLPAEARPDYAERLAESAGEAAAAILHLVAAGRAGEAVAGGLVCDLLFSKLGASDADAGLARAVGRFEERQLGGMTLSPEAGRAWAVAAGELVRQRLTAGGETALALWHTQAQGLVRELRIEEQATERSAWLPAAFARRVRRFAEAVAAWLDSPDTPGLQEMAGLAADVRRHELASTRKADLEAVNMTLRLCRWLAASGLQAPAGSFADSADAYAREGSFADLARTVLADLQNLTEPLAPGVRDRLLRAVTDRRELEARRFAELLAKWSEVPTATDALVPIESVLDRIVAPLAATGPVLLLVLDGLSFAVFRELSADLSKRGWDEMRPREAAIRFCGVSLLPSVTQVCRTSLFCGERRTGTAATESQGFAAHPGLRAQGAANLPPILFHKDDLRGEGAGLSAKVKSEVERAGRRVVGVVLNVVDDQLPKGHQLMPRWQVEDVRYLGDVLQSALDVGRTIVLTADHGHLVERDTELRRHEGGGARYRPAGERMAEGEIKVRGPRVLLGGEEGLVLAWSERLRYTAIQSGYHGGASPQEVLVPLSVWVAAGGDLPEWKSAADEPAWWRDEGVQPVSAALAAPAVPAAPATGKSRPKAAPAGQGVLFAEVPAPLPAAAAVAEPWLAALFASPAYREQKGRAARQSLADERVAEVLAALARQGGGMTPAALARQLEIPLSRVHGLLAALQRLLNVEGFPVLVFEPESDKVTFDRALLGKQFLGGEGE